MAVSDNAAQLLNALQSGTVRNAGGIFLNSQRKPIGLSATDMYHAVRELCASGHRVERIDAGGRPEWAIRPAIDVGFRATAN